MDIPESEMKIRNLVLFHFLANSFSGPFLFLFLKPSQFYDAADDEDKINQNLISFVSV